MISAQRHDVAALAHTPIEKIEKTADRHVEPRQGVLYFMTARTEPVPDQIQRRKPDGQQVWRGAASELERVYRCRGQPEQIVVGNRADLPQRVGRAAGKEAGA